MYAIIATGGKQYKVEEGMTLFVEKLDVADGGKVVFDKVLALSNADEVTFGAPYVEGATVSAVVVKQVKGEKIRIIKHKAKKGYRKRQGHRQTYSQITIGKIGVKKAKAEKAEADVAEAPKPAKKTTKKAATEAKAE